MSYNRQQHYGHQHAVVPNYPEHGEYADIDEPAVAETRPNIFPAYPLFAREEISNTRTLDPYPSTQSPQGWTPYDPPFRQQPLSNVPYPSPSPFPPPTLLPPPPTHTQMFHSKAPGSLNPANDIFYRIPDGYRLRTEQRCEKCRKRKAKCSGEHPACERSIARSLVPEGYRLHTEQACEKCRQRKTKCSGEHPSCKRCITRSLVCEYAKEGRVRGPKKPKPKPSVTSMGSPTSGTSTATSAARNGETTPTSSKTGEYSARAGGPYRSQSSHSSGGSSDERHIEASGRSLFLPTSPGGREVQSSHSEYPYCQATSNSPLSSSPSFSRGRRTGIDAVPTPSTSRHSSLDEHPSPRSHLMYVHLETASSLYRLSGSAIEDEGRPRLGSSERVEVRVSDNVPGMEVRPLPPNAHLYPYQYSLQTQDQQWGVPERGHLPETIGRPRQHHSYRYHHPDQAGQPFQTQRDPFTARSADFPATGTSQLHALSPISIAQLRRMMSETDQSPPVPAPGPKGGEGAVH